MRKPQINWNIVEQEMRASVRGQRCDSSVFAPALAADPERYDRLHAQVKGDAVSELNPFENKGPNQ